MQLCVLAYDSDRFGYAKSGGENECTRVVHAGLRCIKSHAFCCTAAYSSKIVTSHKYAGIKAEAAGIKEICIWSNVFAVRYFDVA